jgi:TRAP-type C4-dicarboxylate transport system substrate-binding protein
MSLTSRKLTRRSALGVIGGALAAPALITRGRAQTTLKLHHMLPPVAPMHKAVFEPWVQTLAEQSDGALKVDIYPAMQLGGGPPQLADQAKDGIADITWTLAVYTPGRFPVHETFSLPFMNTTAEATSVALWKFMAENAGDEYAGMQPLAFHVHAPGKFHMREKAIQSKADLAGLRIRAPNQAVGDALQILGAEPVFFPVTEMAQGLSSGVIDGTLLPYEVVPVFKLHELTKVHVSAASTGRGLYGNSFAVVMNQAAYEGLSDDLRKVIDENSGEAFSRKIGANFDTFENVGLKLCQDRGNQFVEIPAEEIATWREASQPVIDAWVQMLNDKGHDGAMLLQRANELIDAESA